MADARAILLALFVAATGLANSGYSADPADATAAPDPDKALGPGDTVTFQITEDDARPVTLRVTDNGFLPVPYLGNVPASGKSCAELAVQIKKQLEATIYRSATVKLAIDHIAPAPQHAPMKVNIFGNVPRVGLLEIPFGDKLTISQAIAKAGGATEFGDLKKVKFTRRNPDGKTSTTTVVDVGAMIEKGDLSKDVQLQDGDSIFVPKKWIVIGGGP